MDDKIPTIIIVIAPGDYPIFIEALFLACLEL
jgi:hypothetical protein